MRISTVATTLVLLGSAGLCGCAKVDDQLPTDVTTAVTHDFNQGDAQKTASHYTDDAQILPPRHAAIEGRPAIAAFFAANIDKYIGFGNNPSWTLVRGDVGIEQGIYTVRNVRIGQNVETGKYIRIWKKIGGGWMLYRDMFSPDSAVAEAVDVSPEESAPIENPTK
jgi:ketosteroid isomerase-like protein